MNRSKIVRLVAITLVGLFLWLRLYKIQTSLLFFNDIGRDFLVLAQMQQQLKPPLLGPQTSALPYNQSAVYFYLLFPIFWLTGQSFFSTIITVVIYYLGFFALGLQYFLKKQRPLIYRFLALCLLVIIHPQVIIQNRFVWNPSFVLPLILTSFYAWAQLKKRFSIKLLTIFSLASALAISLNYSVAPVIIAMAGLSLAHFRSDWRWLKLGLGLLLGMILWNLPTIIFELRHHFLLTNLLIYGEKLPQSSVSVSAKLHDLVLYTLPGLTSLQQKSLIGLLLFGTLLSWRQKSQPNRNLLRLSSWVFALALILTLLVPISFQAHYIFGLLGIAMIMLVHMKRPFMLMGVGLLSVIWLNPTQLTGYFAPAFRSVESSNQCAAQVCAQIDEPIFVSVQSDLHPYHNGMEWKYLLMRNGCQIKELDTQLDQAELMVVMVDHSQYSHGSTAYNELTQFGPSLEEKRFDCQDNLTAVLIRKISNSP